MKSALIETKIECLILRTKYKLDTESINYSNVSRNDMIMGGIILCENFIFDKYLTPASKQKTETTLERNPELFGRGLVKLKRSQSPQASRYFNFLKAYEVAAIK